MADEIDADHTRVADYHYELPPSSIADEPCEPREAARLLVCSRSDPSRVVHAHVGDLPSFLDAGDLLVVNETKVLPHRLIGQRATGGRIECLILERELDGTGAVGFLRPSKRLRASERIVFERGALVIELREARERGRWRFDIVEPDVGQITSRLERFGRAPLPPYLERDPDAEDVAKDRERYQTVFARNPGAVAAPTAGLHLTNDLLARLDARGVGRAAVTLHVGEGTFEPVRVDDVRDHVMHEERYELAPETAVAIEGTQERGGRIVAAGTTTARVLETCYDGTRLVAGSGATRLFLRPGHGPRLVDVLLTNFHLPESTLLMLVASMLGRERTLALYRSAIESGYRFFSFGDAMLILP
ncbi:MAG: tRNA preQ1(34) S-adenosylmethionine ribosyltransferase-isomerase QueA [Planctomycetes bacterium]|nr:tRNA preQ1(34) S-adenosylmethionine ribosyltransferase-isomerase QueA [Planctomycetota bacterium]MCB9916919.1 tRNA preQ1(34) S-adenosylmethionine ribosyltransferase-isomerase QueA [Planctomycetota bacterium]